jgi:hypothetical protein
VHEHSAVRSHREKIRTLCIDDVPAHAFSPRYHADEQCLPIMSMHMSLYLTMGMGRSDIHMLSM